ncbi:MAG: hypothetical protein RLT05_25120 [Bauldia litoralis]
MMRAIVLALALAGLTVAPAGAASDKVKQQRLDRASSQHFAALMPEAIKDWQATRPKVSWRDGGAEARARYWTTHGNERFTLVYETRTRGLNYKRDLLEKPDLAKRRGYEVRKINDQPALIRAIPGKTEVRIWLGGRILVFAIGSAKIETIEEHLKLIDFKKVGAVK